MFKILLLDNYDSFTYNLLHLIKSVFSGLVDVKRDYEIEIDTILEYDCIIISPGPGSPKTTPMAMNILKICYDKRPILGICLGLQCINEFFGGTTIKSLYPEHGKITTLKHHDVRVYRNIPQNINVARYHSLTIEPGLDIVPTAWAVDDTIMSIRHSELQSFSLQFHPESFLSKYGKQMLENFFITVGLNG